VPVLREPQRDREPDAERAAGNDNGHGYDAMRRGTPPAPSNVAQSRPLTQSAHFA
jgi:hypothetical protein